MNEYPYEKKKKNWILLGYGEEEVEAENTEKREVSIGEV